jgi:peptidoglycan/xylan/chitin deacetylase (PgdA/CDA1 family)
MVVTAPTFDRQLAFFKEHFDIIPLSSLLANGNAHGPSVRPRCVITFDDGWRDNYDVAFPILRHHDVPATIFVTTDFIGTDRAFWHTELIYVLTHAELPRFLGREGMFRAYPGPVRRHLERLARIGRVASAHDVDPVIETVKAMCDDDAIEGLIQELTRAARLPRPPFPERKLFLDWDQVREMAAAGIEIGSHGCSHRILTRLAPEEASEELLRSRADIERHLGRTVQHFAFPDEAANSALLTAAAAAGYQSACLGGSTLEERPLGIRALRRLGMHEDVSRRGPSFDDVLLRLWLSRAPEVRSA